MFANICYNRKIFVGLTVGMENNNGVLRTGIDYTTQALIYQAFTAFWGWG
jgi:hypothetical protein